MQYLKCYLVRDTDLRMLTVPDILKGSPIEVMSRFRAV